MDSQLGEHSHSWPRAALPEAREESDAMSEVQEALLHGGQGTDMVPLRILNIISFPSLLPTHSHPAADEETKL